MDWQILLATSVITYSISVLLQRVLLKNDKSDPIAYSIVFQLLTGILIGIYAMFNGFATPNLVPLIPNLILMTILYGAGNVFIFSALKMIDAAEFTIVFASRALWTIIGAIIFLKESFSMQQTLGTILIILSIVLVSWKKQKFTFSKGFIFSVLAALSFGLAFTNDAFIVNNFDVPSYLTIAFILPSLAVWVIYPKSTAKMKPLFEKKTLLKLGLLGVFYAVSAITIFLAYQVGKNASQIAPLNQTATIITVVLSVIFLKERTDLLRKLLGAIISFVGVVLVK
jgi:drug/metabolite transporter (DMT)-like permease